MVGSSSYSPDLELGSGNGNARWVISASSPKKQVFIVGIFPKMLARAERIKFDSISPMTSSTYLRRVTTTPMILIGYLDDIVARPIITCLILAVLLLLM
jgi:hypothetical protein